MRFGISEWRNTCGIQDKYFHRKKMGKNNEKEQKYYEIRKRSNGQNERP